MALRAAGLAAAVLAALLRPLCADPFGGGGLGDDLYKPFTACERGIKCPAGRRPLQKSVKDKATRVHRESCDKAANMLTVMDPSDLSGLDPSKRKNGAQKLDPCCEKRSICHQICGMSLAECAEEYKRCYRKICRGDRNCNMQASFAVMMSEPTFADEKKGDKCAGYGGKQEAQCDCVPEEDFGVAMRSRVKDFYETFQPQKLTKDANGKYEDLDEDFMAETVYKKFKKGEEHTIWYALLTKYREKLRKQEPPKPNYASPEAYSGPNTDYGAGDSYGGGAGDSADDARAKKRKEKRVQVEEPAPDDDAEVVEL